MKVKHFIQTFFFLWSIFSLDKVWCINKQKNSLVFAFVGEREYKMSARPVLPWTAAREWSPRDCSSSSIIEKLSIVGPQGSWHPRWDMKLEPWRLSATFKGIWLQCKARRWWRRSSSTIPPAPDKLPLTVMALPEGGSESSFKETFELTWGDWRPLCCNLKSQPINSPQGQ